ncbi:hypothetical protein AU468_08820 [Alkalispirochaeta sphaeroplastigenens]|uniref:Aminotransferase class III n=1 Tax=Alkalispirochaeta sphaeroplastigenens TaxID=1187066 RepID=A0A2S4JN58_9SPIO|nr:hypothetical protein [Alkalispirochaeta sphaeroplastigenens]POR00964.1 hypothetical protein AU468_08820 [Alkalispirochaeta sphaeroplastigenens]
MTLGEGLLPRGCRVRRARGWRLYDQGGTRYVDFWQAGGSAFLGHRPGSLARTVAAEIDRGLWAPLPTPWKGRLERSLVRLADRAGCRELHVPGEGLARSLPRWYPLSEEDPPAEALVILPFPAAREGSSSLLQAGLAVAAELLWQYLDSPEARERLDLARSLPAPPGWRRDGVYWVPLPGASLPRQEALGRQIVLPPQAGERLICPGELSRRERKNWEDLCACWTG